MPALSFRPASTEVERRAAIAMIRAGAGGAVFSFRRIRKHFTRDTFETEAEAKAEAEAEAEAKETAITMQKECLVVAGANVPKMIGLLIHAMLLFGSIEYERIIEIGECVDGIIIRGDDAVDEIRETARDENAKEARRPVIETAQKINAMVSIAKSA